MVATKAFRENFVVDGVRIKRLLASGVLWLEKNVEQVNQLNVFPVPDGDTGTNMYLTMRHAFQKVALITDNHVGKISAALAEGAVIGSRGNSGVILSQIWAGVADALRDVPELNAEALAEACRRANDMAYKSVQVPVEGTILTVCRAMTNAVIEHYEEMPDLVALLKKMVYAGRSALRRTPDQLPRLKEAGVVDSGGQGLVLIFEGMLFPLIGRDMAEEVEAPIERHAWEQAIQPDDDEGYGYDVQFLMRGERLNIDQVRADIQNMGWSTLVVGTHDLIKVHVHVHDPGAPLSYAIGMGASLHNLVVENMQAQFHEYVEQRKARVSDTQDDGTDDSDNAPDPAVGVIAVVSGGGLSRLFRRELGAAHVITGGQTMNPSTGDFLEAIDAITSHDVILLPNNKNVLLAAQAAARQAIHKNVRVVSSTTIPQGISALFEYGNLCANGTCTIDHLVDAMSIACDSVVTAEVTRSIRDTVTNGVTVREGQWIGLLNDVLVTTHDDQYELVCELLLKGGADERERATFYYGENVSETQARKFVSDVAREFDRLEFEVVAGGQPLYPYIVSLE